MRDRLIELIGQSSMRNLRSQPLLVEQIADHLLANGVIVLPCKVGDVVYYPSFNIGMVSSYKVVSIKLNSKGLYVVCENHLSKSQMTHRATQIGETIFLTQREAEIALAKRRTNDE
jgi:hypothetical protein